MTQTAGATVATTTSYAYKYFDDAKQAVITKSQGGQVKKSTLTYDGNGNIKSHADEGTGVTKTYRMDANGQVIKRSYGIASTNHYYYYADGNRIGDVGNSPEDKLRISYAEQLARNARVESADQRRSRYMSPGARTADFDQNYEPINDSYPGSAASSYVVRRDGETLRSIAQALWGDSALWYLIAEANGLLGDGNQAAGRVLLIPNKVTNIHNNSTTWRPYSAGEAIGRTDPTLPAPINFEGINLADLRTSWMAANPGGDFGSSLEFMQYTHYMNATRGVHGVSGPMSMAGLDGNARAGWLGLPPVSAMPGWAMGRVAWADVSMHSIARSAAPRLVSGRTPEWLFGRLDGTAWMDRERFISSWAADNRKLINQVERAADPARYTSNAQSYWSRNPVAPLIGAAIAAPDWRNFEEIVDDWTSPSGTIRSLSARLDSGSLLNQVEAAAGTRRGTVAVSEPRLVGLDPQYRDTAGAIVYGTPGSTRQFGDITASPYVLSDVPMPQSLHGPMVASWDEIGTGFIGVPIADGRYRFMEAPEGYTVPSKAWTQLADLAAGTWDALKALPGAVVDTALAVPDAYRMLGNQVFGDGRGVETWSRLGEEIQAGRVNFQSLYRGVINASPVGVFGHMLNGYYRAAGQSIVSTAVGVASGPALSRTTSWLNGLPVLGYELPLSTLLTRSALSMQRSVMWVGEQLRNAAGRFKVAAGDGLTTLKNTWAQGMENLAAPRALNSQFGGLLIDVPDALVQAESSALRRIGESNRAGSPMADLRRAYQQARGQVDFPHIESDVTFKANGQVKAQGGHFSTSPRLQRLPATETVSPNGAIYGQVKLQGPDGNFYLKSNNNGFATMTPDTWSLARAKGEMSQAFLNRTLDPSGKWSGTSSGVEFRFNPPNSNVPLWRGFPLP